MPPDAGSLGRTPHRGPILDESIPKRDGHTGKRSESNGKRPSSLEESSNVHKKRKFSQMKDSGDTYNVIHTSPAIKEEPGLPIDDSPNSSGSTSPGAFSVKQKLSTGKVLQGYSNANGNSGVTIFGPSPRLDDFSGMVEEEERDWLGNSLLKASNVENRTSSSGLTELSMWNISESEMHTTEMEEETSDDESVVSVLSLGKERQEKVKSERSSRGPETINREESNDPPSRRDTVQDQNHIASVGPSVSGVVGHERMEQGTPHRTISHNLDDQIRDAFNALSGDGVNEVDRINGRDDQTTVRGEPRQRAPPKTQVSARDISRSWKTANPADKMLMKMKLRGCGWKEIRKAWEELTGEQPAPSTLPNRYNRIKDNLTRLRSGDGQRLIDAAAEVEAEFQRSKWRLIAETMERAGAAKYSHAFVQRKYNEFSRNGDPSRSLRDDENSDSPNSDSDTEGNITSGLRPLRSGPTTVELPQVNTRELPP